MRPADAVPRTRKSRTQRAATTRQQLLYAAEEHFLRAGYHRTTLDEIADAAGYTKGAVYSAFACKAELFLAVFDHVMDRRGDELEHALSPCTNDQERLAAIAEPSVVEGAGRFLLVTIEFWVHVAWEPAMLEAFSVRYGKLRARIAAIGCANDVDAPDDWAIMTLALSNGLALERLIDAGTLSPDLMAGVPARLAGAGRTR